MSTTASQRPVALITGASSGIGAAVARRMAAANCNVVLTYRKNKPGAEDVANSCHTVGSEALIVQGDVANDLDCRRIMSFASTQFGRIDYLVNNAGTTRFADTRDLDGLDGTDFARIFAVNVTGVFQMSRAARPVLHAASGAIVNVSSHSAFSGFGSSSAYAASKAALNTLTLSLARALAPRIRVNAVCPGFVDTDWLSRGMGNHKATAFKARWAAAAPLRRLITPDDVAETVSWLARRATGVTGQLLVVDAGTHLNMGLSLAHEHESGGSA